MPTVGNHIQIAGTAGAAFEAGYNYVVTEGHDEVRGHDQLQNVADVSVQVT